MTLSVQVGRYLSDHNMDYRLVHHPKTENSMATAILAYVSPSKLAKAVILQSRDGTDYCMAVIPADHKLKLSWVNNTLKKQFHLVGESTLLELFDDCVVGAVPPLADAYSLPSVWAVELLEADEIFFEAGDHRSLIQLPGRHIRELNRHGCFAAISRNEIMERELRFPDIETGTFYH